MTTIYVNGVSPLNPWSAEQVVRLNGGDFAGCDAWWNWTFWALQNPGFGKDVGSNLVHKAGGAPKIAKLVQTTTSSRLGPW